MNATIQEIEGIDDYWGPAFRSVYEGEGHEAFVQQLDERIVQHDKEIEKLCNFHYQKKRKRGRRPIKSKGVYEEQGALQSSMSELELNNNQIPKRARIVPKILRGGYINTFPEPGTLCEPSSSHNSSKVPDHNIPDDNLEDTLDMGISSDEYEQITEYHTMQQLKQAKLMSNEPDTSGDLRLYLRNRNRHTDASVVRQNLLISVKESGNRFKQQRDKFSLETADRQIGTRDQRPEDSPNDLRSYLQSKLTDEQLGQKKSSFSEHSRKIPQEANQYDKRHNHQVHDSELSGTFSSKYHVVQNQDDVIRYEKRQSRRPLSSEHFKTQDWHERIEYDTDHRRTLSSERTRKQSQPEAMQYEGQRHSSAEHGKVQTRSPSLGPRRRSRQENFERQSQSRHESTVQDINKFSKTNHQTVQNRPMSADGQTRPQFAEHNIKPSWLSSSEHHTRQKLHETIDRSPSPYSFKEHIRPRIPHRIQSQHVFANQNKGQSHHSVEYERYHSRHESSERNNIQRRSSSTEHIRQSLPSSSDNYKQGSNIEYHKDHNQYVLEVQNRGRRRFSTDYDRKNQSSHVSAEYERSQGRQELTGCISKSRPLSSERNQRKEYQRRPSSHALADVKRKSLCERVEIHRPASSEHHIRYRPLLAAGHDRDQNCDASDPHIFRHEQQQISQSHNSSAEHYLQSSQSTECNRDRNRYNSADGYGRRSRPTSADNNIRQNRLSYSKFESQIRHKIAETQQTTRNNECIECFSDKRCSLHPDHLGNAQSDLHSAGVTSSHNRSYLSAELQQEKLRDNSEHCYIVDNRLLPPNIGRQASAETCLEQHRPLSEAQRETRPKSSDHEGTQCRPLTTQRQSTTVELFEGPVTGQHNSAPDKLAKPNNEECTAKLVPSHRITSSQFFKNEILELQLSHADRNNIENLKSFDRQHKENPATTEVKSCCNSLIQASDIVLISDSDTDISMDISPPRYNSPFYTTNPEIQNATDVFTTIDMRSNLTFQLASAILPRGSLETRNHSRESLAEMSSIQDNSENNNDSVETVIVDLGQKTVEARQCITPELDLKNEPNETLCDANSLNATNESCKVVEPHPNQDNKDPELKQHSKSNVKCEPIENITNRESISTVDENIVRNRLPLLEVPEFSKRQPSSSQRCDNATRSGFHKTEIKYQIYNKTFNTVASTSKTDHGVNSFCSPNNEDKHDQIIAEASPPSSKEGSFKVSVRDVSSINLLLSGVKTDPLNAVFNKTFECEDDHDEVSAVSTCSWYTPRKIIFENYLVQHKLLYKSASVNSCDPRLQPRINSTSIENLNELKKSKVFCEIDDVAESEIDIKADITVATKGDSHDTSIDGQNEIHKPEDENKPMAPNFAGKCGKLVLDKPKSSKDNSCITIKVQISPESPEIQDEQFNISTNLKPIAIETDVSNNIAIFDSSNKNHNINDWIDSVNKIAAVRNWRDQQVVGYAIPKIMGYGFHSNLSWSEWQEELRTAFPPRVNYGKLLLDMLNTKAKVGDSLVDYYNAKKVLLDQCSINGEKAIECIIFGIEDESVRTILESIDFVNEEQLLTFLTEHQQTILKENFLLLCNSGFIDSIRELLEVRSHAEELHAEISNVDANVKETTEAICTKAEELIRARRVELNIAATIEKMELCLPLLDTYSKLKTQVEAKRYYPALKTLEQLEHVLLPRVGPYKWCATISADIPRLRQAIRDASMADLRDFLENIRKLSPQVGALSLKQSQEMMGRNLAAIVKNKKEKALLSTNEIEPASQCPHELVDFSPLHRCMHIHTVLGAKNDFIQYYRAQRAQQARLVLIPQGNLHDSIRGVKDYLHAVLGFFILEEHLLSAAQGLVSKDWLLDTWSMSVNKVASTLRTNTSLITDPTLMLSIKHQIVLFINTVKCYGLPVEPLPTLLQEMAEHYTEVLMQRWVAVFRDILDKAAFTPIQVNNEDEYDDVANNFPYDASDLEMQPFPKSFPFSSIVPSVYLQVKEFIYAWLKYSSGLGLGGGRRAAAARHSASLLLSRSFTGCLSALFHSPLPLMQLVQIIVDTQYLEDATVCLYEFISNITGSGPVSTQPVAGLFQTARDEAEQQICDNLQKKVDEFLDLENYDWLLVEPTGQASSFVTDMISYLKGVMESLHQLPEQARVAAVRAATNRIAVRLRNLLLEPAVKQISSGALYQLDLDVMQCEQFAASEPVTGLREGELLEHFASLRQLLDLITGWDWSSYLHDVGIEGGKYALVTPRDAATLLEKFKEAEQKSSVFSVLKKNERDKRKLLDTVLKQLKQLQNQDGS